MNDVVIEVAYPSGAFKSSWGPPCADPSGCFGVGLDATNCSSVGPTPSDNLDVPTGDLFDGRVTEVLVTDQTGSPFGFKSVLSIDDASIADVVRDRSYLGGVEAVILVGNASNTIYVLEAFAVGCGGAGDGGGGGDGGDAGGGGVPATTGFGVAVAILTLMGAGGYLLRRREE